MVRGGLKRGEGRRREREATYGAKVSRCGLAGPGDGLDGVLRRSRQRSRSLRDDNQKTDGERNGFACSPGVQSCSRELLCLVFAVDEVLGDGFEIVGGGAKGLNGGKGVGDELLGVGERAGDAVGETIDSGPCGLGDGGVLAGGFAELCGLLCDVEDVVDDLEGEAGVPAEDAEAIEGVVRGAGDVAAGDDRDGDEGAGLGAVDLLDEGGGGWLPFGFEVDDLTADHAGRLTGGEVEVDLGGCRADTGADGAGDLLEDVDGGDGGAVEAGDGVEGEGLEGVAGEDGDGVAEDFVAGGLAAAEVVVVEGGEVVVDKRVGVEHLDGGAELDGGLLGRDGRRGEPAGEAPGLKAEDGTEALAAGKDAVAHGAMDGVRGGIRRGQKPLEGAIGALGTGADELLYMGCHGALMIREGARAQAIDGSMRRRTVGLRLGRAVAGAA